MHREVAIMDYLEGGYILERGQEMGRGKSHCTGKEDKKTAPKIQMCIT